MCFVYDDANFGTEAQIFVKKNVHKKMQTHI